MNEQELEQEILGDDVRITADPQVLRDKYRQWLEPILSILVVALIGLVIWLLVIVLDVRTSQDTDSVDRARGSANTCRLLGALSLDISDPDGRCQDPEVKAYWLEYQGEQTGAAKASTDALIVICRLAAAGELAGSIPECLGVNVDG